ncbi:MAG: tyrosine-type recombinase/integrase [Tepidisphaerales bacterium]
MLLAEYERQAAATVKARSVVTQRQTVTSLRKYLGENTPAAAVSALHADRWRQAMVASGLSPATVSRRVKTARTIWRRGMRWGMVASNPFTDTPAGPQHNPARQAFVEAATFAKVLDKAPDLGWRLLLVLARYGGLRTPSEPFALKWEHVLWDRNRILITSSKTEGLAGGGTRWLPIFPELREVLMMAFEAAEPGAVYVIPDELRLRGTGANLRTRLLKIIRRAGVDPWPRLWHALRGSRATELCQEGWPSHVVASWLGHGVATANKHYLTTTDSDFDLAAAGCTQKRTRATAETEGIQGKLTGTEPRKPAGFPEDSTFLPDCQNFAMTPRGFEPLYPP